MADVQLLELVPRHFETVWHLQQFHHWYLVRGQMCLLLRNGWEFGETSEIGVVPTTISNPILAWLLQETNNWSSFLKISTFFLHFLPLSLLFSALLF